MSALASRRAFLTGGLAGEEDRVMRPPGAAREKFTDLCTQCGDCIAACPEEVLTTDRNGHPVFQPQGEGCTFCGDCADVCKTGALDLARFAQWPWRARVAETCLSLNAISCRVCQDSCDQDAIRFRLQTGGRADLILDTDSCVGCGACAAACPAGAVTLQQIQPATLEAF